MGSMYAWATPNYLLDHMSIDQILMYYDYGLEYEVNKANILVNRIGVGFFGVEEEPKKQKKESDYDDTPDREAFYKRYGDKIKRPEKGGSK
ncbi:hypothetical protein [Heyndrickxia oleronia]|uniref:hypothetical protein n=1 Tax=Heyndrickxia oleronia TaxID=38875 RepID=UPI001C0EC966|nr:hypothetical protein [Heyndrickxia oleronia]MBU5214559.1 hypothetical protein [Heyndrickxia oleronia]